VLGLAIVAFSLAGLFKSRQLSRRRQGREPRRHDENTSAGVTA
jgi:hypothetical protein